MDLYDYQWEVIEPALEGRNIIIWLPTGSGKTRAAVYVTKRHLQNKRNAKVAVLVNKVHLVDQHYSKEFHPHLKDQFEVAAISGDSNEKFFFADAMKRYNVIICTAQILQNALTAQDEERHVELTDFTLLVIDECHHTHKDGVYNKIMEIYTEKKLRGDRELPQILGLTASPGTGGSNKFENAKLHILQICANLDARKIMSPKTHRPQLEEKAPQPQKVFDLTDQRAWDPFEEKLKGVMMSIHEYLDVPGLFGTELGTQIYEQKIVELEKEGAVEASRKKRVCALHLRKYNDALLIHDTVRMLDAFKTLDIFYTLEKIRKTQNDPTEQFLFRVFDENQGTLRQLAMDKTNENPKLLQLEKTLLEHFGASADSRGIIFTRTRQSAHSLHEWMGATGGLAQLARKAAVLTGAGSSSQTKHMTQNEQQEVIQRFRQGELKLLVSTSVAEEGLDIPECNIVIRYGLMTNETAMIQARGRARKETSTYSVLANRGGKEERRERTNECLEELMIRAIKAVQAMPEAEYLLKIGELQRDSIISRKVKQQKLDDKKNTYRAQDVRIHCRNCHEPVAYGDDLRTVEKSHHVNIKPDFKIYYRVSDTPIDFGREMIDWTPGGSISCHCGQEWGMEMIYRAVTLPAISIKNFVMEALDGKRFTHKKWKDVPFAVEELDYAEVCEMHFPE
ncbi:ATP-dependent RNA helicase DHX58 [Ambystoma mexicanum]|uniref:ATP-dependent RNA helicase DHX58 n=1 Tax=Ambystoma mexicanum TaxID=8296 RepID=UPI0037E73C42